MPVGEVEESGGRVWCKLNLFSAQLGVAVVPRSPSVSDSSLSPEPGLQWLRWCCWRNQTEQWQRDTDGTGAAAGHTVKSLASRSIPDPFRDKWTLWIFPRSPSGLCQPPVKRFVYPPSHSILSALKKEICIGVPLVGLLITLLPLLIHFQIFSVSKALS